MQGKDGTQGMGQRQDGAIMPLFAISAVAILGMSGLALDMSHAHLQKTRLQNSLDAAALSAAKVLDQTGNTLVAETAGRDVFTANVNAPGNAALGEALSGGDMTVAVEFSSSLNPFVPATAPARYVRVRAAGMEVDHWFAPLFGLNETEVPGSAVAGPSPTLGNVCNVAPMMVCGTPPASAPPGTTYGYSRGDVEMLKIGAGDSSSVGNGNFYLVRLDGNAGGADVRHAAAGGYENCIATGNDIETEPGNTVGPFAQGINTRVGVYNGPVNASDYPPDWFTNHDNYTEADYNANVDPNYDLDWYLNQMAQVNPAAPPAGVPGRRILTLPVGHCDGLANGQSSVELLGFACFYMITRMQQTGQAVFFGQFKDECSGNGVPGPNPVTGPGPHIIQLYKDPDTADS